mmetsp:Transcript_16907/g.53092  ORF Transcript_16907/g.53092 Transcript_16907/m.53092 type:complete len:203 (-) Transcript_16907:1040-1648(-)
MQHGLKRTAVHGLYKHGRRPLPEPLDVPVLHHLLLALVQRPGQCAILGGPGQHGSGPLAEFGSARRPLPLHLHEGPLQRAVGARLRDHVACPFPHGLDLRRLRLVAPTSLCCCAVHRREGRGEAAVPQGTKNNPASLLPQACYLRSYPLAVLTCSCRRAAPHLRQDGEEAAVLVCVHERLAGLVAQRGHLRRCRPSVPTCGR